MRPYICGSISNGGTATPEEREVNVVAFRVAEGRLKGAGLDPINPERRGHGGETWLDYMRQALRDIAECDGIALLPGWTFSKGAVIEKELAVSLGLPVKTVDQWCSDAMDDMRPKED